MVSEFQAHYAGGAEEGRLKSARGQLEFVRTTELILRTLPPIPHEVADIGGGPGSYSRWLIQLGHQVHLRDAVSLHIEQALRGTHAYASAAVADARNLDLGTHSVDSALLLGPMYHLADVDDRMACLREAIRVVRPGGLVYIAAISRWAQRLDGIMASGIYRKYPNAVDVVDEIEKDGLLRPFRPGGFHAYTHRPGDFLSELSASGLVVETLLGVEGMPLSENETRSRLESTVSRNALLRSARAVESVPELLGLSSHLLATVRTPIL
jgi:SAM-dependent methyltransferase